MAGPSDIPNTHTNPSTNTNTSTNTSTGTSTSTGTNTSNNMNTGSSMAANHKTDSNVHMITPRSGSLAAFAPASRSGSSSGLEARAGAGAGAGAGVRPGSSVGAGGGEMARGLGTWSRKGKERERVYDKNASLVLIGNSGSGKSTVADIASRTLDWPVVEVNTFARECAEGQDSEARLSRVEILQHVLASRPARTVIVCGVEDIDDALCRELLIAFSLQQGPVIQVTRPRQSILDLWESSSRSPQIRDDLHRRWAYYEDICQTISTYIFVSLDCNTKPGHELDNPWPRPPFKPIERDFIRLLRFILGIETNHVSVTPTSPPSYFLSLTYDDVALAIPEIDELGVGIDCWEIRVDLLKSVELEFIAHQVAMLRAASELPILLTLRTKPNGGRYPDIRTDSDAWMQYRAVNALALKLGVEYVDIEMSSRLASEMNARKGHTHLVLSWHDFNGKFSWLGREVRQVYQAASKAGADVVKMCGWAKSFQDNLDLRQFVAETKGGTPLLALNMGPEGKMSRILNRHLTPLSHPLMPTPAAPGQISYFESQQVLFLTGLLPQQKFYLFGTPIGASYSPIFHSAGFRKLGLPYTYEALESAHIEWYEGILADPAFGGASVTNPHKISIMRYLSRLTPAAQAIGAVNTVIATRNGLLGDNTDWRAIKNALQKALNPAHAITSRTSALIYGAGGAARAAVYALWQIGVVNICICNRSIERAERLINDLSRLSPSLDISLTRVDDDRDYRIVISCLPNVDHPPCPPLSRSGGVALELNWAVEASQSPLLQAAAAAPGWIGAAGLDVLLEQGFEQMRAWTGRRAPKKAMREAAYLERKRRLATPL